MDQGDFEGLADDARARAGLEGDEYATPLTVARRLLGADGVRIADGLREPEVLAPLNGRQILFIRKSLPKTGRAFSIAHGIGHVITQLHGCVFETEAERELACDGIGAAIMLPRIVYRSRVRVHNDNWTQLALDFKTTETMVALRYGEVVGTPLAVVAPIVRVRGGAYNWPATPEQFRRLARLPAFPGMKRARLKDDPRRVVLEAEEIFDDVG